MLNWSAVVARREAETERDSWCERDAELVRSGSTTRDRQRQRETRGVSAMLNSCAVVARLETDSFSVVARRETETERDSWCERDAELVRGGTASSTTERLAPALGTAVDRLVDSFLVAAPVTFDRLPRFGSRSRFGSHVRSASSRHSSGSCRHSSTTTPVHRRAPPGRRDPPQSATGKSHLTLKLR